MCFIPEQSPQASPQSPWHRATQTNPGVSTGGNTRGVLRWRGHWKQALFIFQLWVALLWVPSHAGAIQPKEWDVFGECCRFQMELFMRSSHELILNSPFCWKLPVKSMLDVSAGSILETPLSHNQLLQQLRGGWGQAGGAAAFGVIALIYPYNKTKGLFGAERWKKLQLKYVFFPHLKLSAAKRKLWMGPTWKVPFFLWLSRAGARLFSLTEVTPSARIIILFMEAKFCLPKLQIMF